MCSLSNKFMNKIFVFPLFFILLAVTTYASGSYIKEIKTDKDAYYPGADDFVQLYVKVMDDDGTNSFPEEGTKVTYSINSEAGSLLDFDSVDGVYFSKIGLEKFKNGPIQGGIFSNYILGV